jgi:aldehyde dehydrogenase (NAD+)
VKQITIVQKTKLMEEPKAPGHDMELPDFSAPIFGPLKKIRYFWNKGITTQDSFQLMMLRSLKLGAKELETKITESISHDFNMDESSAYRISLLPFFQELNTAFDSLKNWKSGYTLETKMAFYPGTSSVKPQPRGTVLIIGSERNPFGSVLCPLVSALSAGNAVAILPSPSTPRCNELLKQYLDTYLDNRIYHCFGADEKATIDIVGQEPFDSICYTGPEMMAKQVLKLASTHLSPVLLEVEAPVVFVVHSNANLQLASAKIADYKFMHQQLQGTHGQSLILVESSIKVQFQQAYQKEAKIVSGLQLARIADNSGTKINPAQSPGEKEKPSGEVEAPLLDESMSGILPLNLETFSNFDKLNSDIQRLKPYAIGYFGNKSSELRDFLSNKTNSALLFVNECPLLPANLLAPFRNASQNGLGRLRGYDGFCQFSNMRAIYERPNSTFLDFSVRYANDDEQRISKLKRLFVISDINVSTVFCWVYVLCFLTLLAIGLYILNKHNGPLITFPRFQN